MKADSGATKALAIALALLASGWLFYRFRNYLEFVDEGDTAPARDTMTR
jgi:hypothetical protein